MQLEIGDAEEVHAALCYAYNAITTRVGKSERRDARRATLRKLLEDVEKGIISDQVVEETLDEWRSVPEFPKYEMNRNGYMRDVDVPNELIIPETVHPRGWPMVTLYRDQEHHTLVVQRIQGFEWPIVQEV